VCRKANKTKEELIGFTMMEKFPGIEKTDMFAVLKRCMKERIPEIMENEFYFEDENKGWFQLSIQPVPEGIFILSLDITERKKAEEKILNLNAELEQRVKERTQQLEDINKELEAFTYSVSHDLRSPLRAIDGFSKIILEDYESILDEEGKRLFSIIRNYTIHMDNLITDLLSLSRVTRGELKLTMADMFKMVSEIFKETLNKNEIQKYEVKIGKLPDICCDASLMRQVWSNLISNAVKYTSPKETRSIEVSYITNNHHITYYIKDNGVGFNPDYSHKLFGVFQRLHSSSEFEGTGVGLAIVERIINKHGGKVWGEGKINVGAVFYFSLPKKENCN
ncbi:MAG: GHKL domain-containing protein, partial [Melioribacteraceae bacterium]